jgi:hypothetical protein
VDAPGAPRLHFFGSRRRLGAAIIPHHPPLALPADSEGRLRVSLTARSQWHSRHRRCGRRCRCCRLLLLLFQKRQKRLEVKFNLPDIRVRTRSLVLDIHNMRRLSKVPQSLSHAPAGLGAAPIRVNRIVANGHSSRAPGEAIVVCAVESIRGRYLSAILPVLTVETRFSQISRTVCTVHGVVRVISNSARRPKRRAPPDQVLLARVVRKRRVLKSECHSEGRITRWGSKS